MDIVQNHETFCPSVRDRIAHACQGADCTFLLNLERAASSRNVGAAFVLASYTGG
jgi:hypothetical protein